MALYIRYLRAWIGGLDTGLPPALDTAPGTTCVLSWAKKAQRNSATITTKLQQEQPQSGATITKIWRKTKTLLRENARRVLATNFTEGTKAEQLQQ